MVALRHKTMLVITFRKNTVEIKIRKGTNLGNVRTNLCNFRTNVGNFRISPQVSAISVSVSAICVHILLAIPNGYF